MQSLDLNLTICHTNEYVRADIGIIEPSQVHRVTIPSVFWIPRNLFVLINESMRQRLGLGFDKTIAPQVLISTVNKIVPYHGPYRTCETLYVSSDFTSPTGALVYPTLVPDLPVDFVLGTLYFDELGLKWSSVSNRMVTRREYDEEKEQEARRQMFRRVL
jgi:hypothetical protein